MADFSVLTGIAPVVRNIDGVAVVWFENGNQFVQLEEPAYFVFQKEEEGFSREMIAKQCAERYQRPVKESRKFVADLLEGMEGIRNWSARKELEPVNEEELRLKLFSVYSTRNYLMNGKQLRFRFEKRLYELYLHPLLKHLETENHSPDVTLFDLFGHNGRIVLRVNHEVKGIWSEQESHLLNGMAFTQILNAAYGKNDHDWMTIIHASAVTNGTKSIVFTASPGSGKSTMAALLQQRGFRLVSDDFVPVERSTWHVFPFPAAMTVKEGAIGLLSMWYPSLRINEKLQRSRTHKMVRYLPVDGEAEPAPVKEIIFIKYDPAVDFEMEKVPRIEALKMLLDEAWTSPSAENAGLFLDWFKEVTCYRVNYSNNEKALQTIANLFDQ